MKRIFVIGADAEQTAQAMADLAREAAKLNMVLAAAGRQMAAALQRCAALRLSTHVEPRPAPKFGGDRPYLKRKKGRS